MKTNKRLAFNRLSPQLLILLLAYIVCIAAVWFVLAAPSLHRYHVLIEAAAVQRDEWNELNSQYVTDWIDDNQLAEINDQLPNKFESSVILEHMLDIAVKSQVRLVNFSQTATETKRTADSTESNAHASLTLNLELIGSLDSLVDYIDKLQKHKRLYAVQSWSLNEQGESVNDTDVSGSNQPAGTTNRYTLLLTVETYALQKHSP